MLEMLLDCLRRTKPLLDVVGALEDGEAQRGKNFVDPHVHDDLGGRGHQN